MSPPHAWLVLNNNDNLGQLTVCVSGEAEMDWVRRKTVERHYYLGPADS